MVYLLNKNIFATIQNSNFSTVLACDITELVAQISRPRAIQANRGFEGLLQDVMLLGADSASQGAANL